jgi:hypothetical protein
MKVDSPFFDLHELICPHVMEKYGEFAWNFIDPRLVILINTIRDRYGREIIINNYTSGGVYSQRGLRCQNCNTVKERTKDGKIYLSGHITGKAFDFDVSGLVAEEVRVWLKSHPNWCPYSFRLEKNVSWCHLDLYNNTENKIIEFSN